MIGPGTGVRVYLACGATDMRKGIAGLSAMAQDVLRQKPASGAVFAFRGRKGDRLKLLYWDGQAVVHRRACLGPWHRPFHTTFGPLIAFPSGCVIRPARRS